MGSYSYPTHLLACLLLTALLLFPACNQSPTGPASTPQMNVRGITLADWTPNGYATSPASVAIDDIAATGANTIVFVVTAYQTSSTSNQVVVDPGRTPTEFAVATAILRARGAGLAGLAASIKPHVDLDNGAWRGTIRPDNPSLWFESYKEFVVAWAAFAEQQNVEQFVVGTELAGTIMHDDQWRAVIGEIRSVFSGELVYAASWDEASNVPFWDALDVVGVNFYAPVASRSDTGRFEILVSWQKWLDRLRILHKKAGRDIVLTEIGYRSVDGAGMHPYDFERTATVDLREQADLYWAALEATGNQPWIRGVFWWNWLVNGAGGAQDDDFTPKNKPAQKELSDAW